MSKTDLLTTAEVAELRGVSVRTIARWVEAGKLVAAIKTPGPRGAYLFRPEDVTESAA